MEFISHGSHLLSLLSEVIIKHNTLYYLPKVKKKWSKLVLVSAIFLMLCKADFVGNNCTLHTIKSVGKKVGIKSKQVFKLCQLYVFFGILMEKFLLFS